MTAGGGNGPPKASVVSMTPTSVLLGSFDHMLPMPPAQPYDPMVGASPVRRTCTPTPRPHPCEPSGDGPGAPPAAPIWSVVMASTDERDRREDPSGGGPPDKRIRPKAFTSARVEPRPALPAGKVGGSIH